MTFTSKDFTVAIVGGGMCGLACAYGLANAGIKSDVFEAAAHYHEIGAGVGFGPNAIRVLRELGLFDTILEVSGQPKANQRLFNMISGLGDHEQVFDYANSSGEDGNEGLGVYRPKFLDAVMPLLNPDITTTHFNKRCVSVERSESGPQRLHFSDGTIHEADLIIGADGIKSATRSAVICSDDDRRLAFSGTYAYRGLIPIDILEAAGVKANIRGRPHCWVGIGKHIITFPIQNATVINVVAFYTGNGALTSAHPYPWVESVPQAELLDRFSDWGNDAMILLKHLKQPSRWSIHTLHPPLRSYVNGRVVLVGDAAHGMVPHLGAGVGQGFEDTYALCRLLGHAYVQKSNLDSILKMYNDIRPPRANMVLKRSFRAGKIYESYGSGMYDITQMREQLAGIWEPVWRFDLDGQVSLVIQEFESLNRSGK